VVPAFLIGRLAVDRRYQGQGWGRFLLADALRRCIDSGIVGFAVVVDAKGDNALV
jgi:GNAT superfamily N-acetyltransferase